MHEKLFNKGLWVIFLLVALLLGGSGFAAIESGAIYVNGRGGRTGGQPARKLRLLIGDQHRFL